MKLSEIAIFTDNVNSVADFYQRLLGTEPMHREEGLAIFQSGDAHLLIHMRYEPTEGLPPCENHTAFAVEDLEAAVTELSQRGITLEIPPREYDWGRSAYLRDPEGRLLELHQPPA
jgi:catechol 2,3-dioxygenase-like lactoylglutathione lyase family enzyme